MNAKEKLINLINTTLKGKKGFEGGLLETVQYQYIPAAFVDQIHLDTEIVEMNFANGKTLSVVMKSYISMEHDEASITNIVTGRYGTDFFIEVLNDEGELQNNVDVINKDDAFVNQLIEVGILAEGEVKELESEFENAVLDYVGYASSLESLQHNYSIENMGVSMKNKHKFVKHLMINGGPLFVLEPTALETELEDYKDTLYYSMSTPEIEQEKLSLENTLKVLLNKALAKVFPEVSVLSGTLTYNNDVCYDSFSTEWQVKCQISDGEEEVEFQMNMSEKQLPKTNTYYKYYRNPENISEKKENWEKVFVELDWYLRSNDVTDAIFNELFEAMLILEDRAYAQNLLSNNPQLLSYFKEFMYTSGIISFILTEEDNIIPVLNDGIVAKYID